VTVLDEVRTSLVYLLSTFVEVVPRLYRDLEDALAESYPDLKAGESFLSLQRSLVEIEDHIQNARRYYNAVVRDLNTKIAQFPANLVAGPMGFQAQEFFGLTSESEGAVPRVDV
jgi:LemA protein